MCIYEVLLYIYEALFTYTWFFFIYTRFFVVYMRSFSLFFHEYEVLFFFSFFFFIHLHPLDRIADYAPLALDGKREVSVSWGSVSGVGVSPGCSLWVCLKRLGVGIFGLGSRCISGASCPLRRQQLHKTPSIT